MKGEMKTVGVFAVLAALAFAGSAFGNTWSDHARLDEFTGDVRTYATTSIAGRPYRRASLVVGCDQKGGERKLFVYIDFDYLNLTGGTVYTETGEYLFDNGDTGRLTFGHSDSRRALFVQRVDGRGMDASRFHADTNTYSNVGEWLVRKLADRSEFKVRVTYFKHGRTVLRFSLAGSGDHIANVLAACEIGRQPVVASPPTDAELKQLGHSHGKRGWIDKKSGRRCGYEDTAERISFQTAVEKGGRCEFHQ